VKGAAQQEKNAAAAAHHAAKHARKEARKAEKHARKAREAAEKKAIEDAARKVKEEKDGKYKMMFDNNGLGQFHPIFMEHGYDAPETVHDLAEEDLRSFGMKGGHIQKFYQTFSRGATYIVHNGQLNSNSAGLGYRPAKNAAIDVHRVAAWGSKVQGIDQLDGWLKVGSRYLPMEVNGSVVIYPEAQGPPPPKTMLPSLDDKVPGLKQGLAQYDLGAESNSDSDSSDY